ncbi:mCG146503, partial [Mus musculus]
EQWRQQLQTDIWERNSLNCDS